jgi:HAMP domain-containing protein
MDETLMKIRILVKAETTLLKASARRAGMRGRLYAVAIGLILLTVIMVNLAAYQYLSETRSAAVAALIVAIVNAVLAVIVIVMAVRIEPGPEESMVREIRELALTELSADMNAVKEEFGQVKNDLEKVKNGVSSALGMFKSGGAGIGSLAPILGLITSMLKK